MKRTSATIFCLLVANVVFGFWIATPLEELASYSDYIVVGEVRALLADAKWERVKVRLQVLECMKGDVPAGKELVFEAPFSLHPDIGGQRAVLSSFASNKVYGVFLKKAARKVPWHEPWARLKPNPHPEEISKKYTVSNMNSGAIKFVFTSGNFTNLAPGETVVRTNFHDPFANDAGGTRTIHAEQADVAYHSTPIQMTKEDDGVLVVDWEKRLYRHGIQTDPAWKPLDDIKEKAKAPEKTVEPARIIVAPAGAR